MRRRPQIESLEVRQMLASDVAPLWTEDFISSPGLLSGPIVDSQSNIFGGAAAAGNEIGGSAAVQPAETLQGDYNLDGMVNAADYVVWRDLASTGLGPKADGNRDGVVNNDDYAVWRTNFGAVGLGGFGIESGGSGSVVPPSPLGPTFTVHPSYTTGYQSAPAAANLTGGESVVVWSGQGPGGVVPGVWAQRVDAAGNVIGSTFRVDTAATAGYNPTVASDGDNRFVVVWHDVNASGQAKIYARRYSFTQAGGMTALDATPISVTTVASFDYYPSVSVASDETFVVSWRGWNATNGTYDVFARRYAANGTAVNSQFAVYNGTTEDYSDRHSLVADTTGFHFIWRSASAGSASTVLWTRRVSYNGSNVTLGTTTALAGSTEGIYDASLARDSQGNLLAVWSQATSGSLTTVSARRFSSSQWGTAFNLATSQNLGILTNVKGDSNGRFAIALYQIPRPGATAPFNTGVFVQLYDPAQPSGSQLSTPVVVSSSSTNVSESFVSSPALAVTPSGDVLVAWAGFNAAQTNSEIYARRYTPPLAGLIVSELGDVYDSNFSDGHLTLREALLVAAQLPGHNTIRFAESLFADGPKTINLTYDSPGGDTLPDQLNVNSSVTIVGPGADLLTVNGGNQTRVMYVYSGWTPVTIEGLTIAGGNASHGGGVFAVYSDLTLRKSRITGNTATVMGGGIYSAQANTIRVIESEISDNLVTGSNGRGAGIMQTHLRDYWQYLSVQNSTISGNQATGANGRGGGIYAYAYNTDGYAEVSLNIRNSTITNNRATTGSGIVTAVYYSGNSFGDVHNTIIAGNTNLSGARDDVYGYGFGDATYNVIGKDWVGDFSDGVSGNIVLEDTEDAGLASLDFYGGTTRTHALVAGSLAIDAGRDAVSPSGGPASLSRDQRGYDRFWDDSYAANTGFSGSTVDIGAFEYDSVPADFIYFDKDGTLYVNDHYTDSNNITISQALGADSVDYVTVNGVLTKVRTADVRAIEVFGAEGADTINLQGIDPARFPQLHSGNITVIGGTEGDIILGSALGERFDGGEGNDQLFGRDGNDILIGGAGFDRVIGEGGDDILYGGPLAGQIGVDTGAQFRGGAGNDWIEGGSSNDRYEYVMPNEFGDDVIVDAGGTDHLDFAGHSAGVEIDLTSATLAKNRPGATTPFTVRLGGGEIETVRGSEFDDVIIGSDQANTLDGYTGNDYIYAGGGVDLIYGYDGSDTIAGTSAEDNYAVNPGFDTYEIVDQYDYPDFVTTNNPWLEDPRVANGRVGFNGTQIYFDTAAGAASGRWDMHNVPFGAGKKYVVLATWKEEAALASSAVTFSVTNSTALPGGLPPAGSVNQKMAPNGYRHAGYTWQIVGATAPTSADLSVTMSGAASSGRMYADAVMLVPFASLAKFLPITPPATIPIGGELSITVNGDFLDDAVPNSEKSKLQFRVGDGSPEGVQITPVSGVDGSATLTWRPPHAVGTGTFNIVIELVSSDFPEVVTRYLLPVVVEAVNQQPVVEPIDDQFAAIDEELNFTVVATDDGPSSLLSYRLAAGAPSTAVLDLHTGQFSWWPSSSDIGEVNFTIEVEDQGNPHLVTSIPVTVTVYDPDAPIPTNENTPSALQTVAEDGQLTFSSGNGNAITITQSSAGASGLLELTIVATNGVFSLATGTTLTNLQNSGAFSVGDGVTDRVMTLRATAANLNTVLSGAKFIPAPNYYGPATVRVRAVDLADFPAAVPPGSGKTIAVKVTPGSTIDFDAPDQEFSWYELSSSFEPGVVFGTVTLTGPDVEGRSYSYQIINDPGNPNDNNFDTYFDIDSATGNLSASVDPTSAFVNRKLFGTVRVTDVATGQLQDALITVHLNHVPTSTFGNPPTRTFGYAYEHQIYDSAFDGFGSIFAAFSDLDADTRIPVKINDQTIVYNTPITLPSGGVLTMRADGTFLYNASGFNATYDHDGLVYGYSSAYPSNPDLTDVSDKPKAYADLASSETAYDSFTYTVTDQHGGFATARVRLHIQGENDAPAINASVVTLDTAARNGDIVTEAVASDPDKWGAEQPLSFALLSNAGIDPNSVFEVRTDVETRDVTYTDPNTGNLQILEDVPYYIAVVTIKNASLLSTIPSTYQLKLQVSDSSASSVQFITLKKQATDNPIAADDKHTTWSDAEIRGNILTVDTGYGIDFDPNPGQAPVIYAIDGDPGSVAPSLTGNYGIVLSSGATLTITASGQFIYDPSTSAQLRELAAGDTYEEIIEYTITDNQGGFDDGLFRISVEGVNDFPFAADNEYEVSLGETISGNFITDDGTATGENDDILDFDIDDADTLTLKSITHNGTTYTVSGETTIPWSSGAVLTVWPDGSFTYLPNGSLSLVDEQTALHQFQYTVTDGRLGSESTANVRMTILANPLQVISAVLPYDDSFADADDLVTSDPRIRLTIAGNTSGLSQLQVEYDLTPGTSAFSIDHTQNVTISAGQMIVNFDPRTVMSFTNGSKTIRYRLKLTPTTGAPAYTSYGALRFELVDPVHIGSPVKLHEQTPTVTGNDGIRLANDTGAGDQYSANPPTPSDPSTPSIPTADNDRITRDPRLTGTVLGAISTGGRVDVELTFTVSGNRGGIEPFSGQYDAWNETWIYSNILFKKSITDVSGVTPTFDSRTFVVDPRELTTTGQVYDPNNPAHVRLISEDFHGDVTVTYQLKHYNSSSVQIGPAITGFLPFEFDIERRAEGVSTSVDEFGLLHDTGAADDDRITSDPTLSGKIDVPPPTNPSTSSNDFVARVVMFDIAPYDSDPYDAEFDGRFDGQALVLPDGSFQFRPTNYSDGASTLNLAAGKYAVRYYLSEWDNTAGEFTAPSYDYNLFGFELAADPAPNIAGLALENATGSNGIDPVVYTDVPTTYDATIRGQIDVAELDSGSNTTAPDPNLGNPSPGSEDPFDGFDDEEGTLTNPDGSIGEQLENLIGNLGRVEIEFYVFDTHSETPYLSVPSEFYPYNPPEDPSTAPTAIVSVESDGSFEYLPTGLRADDPNVSSEKLTVWARARRINTLDPGTPAARNYVYSDWFLGAGGSSTAPLEFRYVTPPAAQIINFNLLAPVTPDGGGVHHTFDPQLTGKLQSPASATADVSFVGVEFFHRNVSDTESSITTAEGAPPDGNGFALSDATGSFAYRPVLGTANNLPVDSPRKIFARVVQWDANNQTYIRGPFVTFKIEVEQKQADVRVKTVTMPYLSNPSTNPPSTTNPTIRGTVENPNGGGVGSIRVVFYNDIGPSDVLLGETLTDASGSFEFIPSGLSDQQVVTLKAIAFEYDSITQTFVPGPSTEGDGNSQNDFIFKFLAGTPTGSLIIQNLSLYSDSGTSQTDKRTGNPLMTGRVVNSVTLAPVPGATVRFDHGNNGSYEGVVIADADGRFFYQPVGLPYLAPTGSFNNTIVAAKPRIWNASAGAFQDGTTASHSFDLVDPATNSSADNFGGKLIEYALVTPAATTTDPTVTGRVVSDGPVAGIIVDFDFAGTADADQSVTTDQYGRFTATLALNNAGAVTVRARTRQLNPLTGEYDTSPWTTGASTPPSLAFTYEPTEFERPVIGTVTASQTQITVPVTNASSSDFQSVKVELAYSATGPAFATVNVSGGSAVYSLSGWMPGPYTVYARAIAETGDTDVPKTYSDPDVPKSVSFTLNATQIVLGNIQLVADQGITGDGSTGNPAIKGKIVGPVGANLNNAAVRVSYNGVIFQDLTDSAGNFEVDPATMTPITGTWTGLSSGYTTVSVNINSASGSFSSSSRLHHFVFSTSPDGDTAQGLVSALNTINPFWQTSQTTIDLGSAQATPPSTDDDLSEAELQQQEEERLARQAYEAALAQAQRDYELEIATAQAAFEAATAGQTQYNLQDFVWPDAPDDNALVIPDDSQLPQPPQAPDYTGPEFNAEENGTYWSLVSQAQSLYYQAWIAAEINLNGDIYDANVDHNERVMEAGDEYSESAEATYNRFIELFYFNYEDANAPDFEELIDKWLEYREDIIEAWERANEKISARSERDNKRIQAYYQAADEARQPVYQEWGNDRDDAEDWWRDEADQSEPEDIAEYDYKKYKADKKADLALEKINAELIRNVEPIYRDLRKFISDATRDALKDEFTARRKIYDLFRNFFSDDLVDSIGDWKALTLGGEGGMDGLAVAQKEYEDAVAASTKQRDQEISAARYTHGQAMSTAEYNLAVAKAGARKAAAQSWAAALSNPGSGGSAQLARWATYQTALANHEYNYEVAVATLARTRDNSIAQAKYSGSNSEQYKIAAAVETRDKAFIQQEFNRTSDLTTAFHDMRVETEEAYLARDIEVSEAWEDRWHEYAGHLNTLEKKMADVNYTYSLRTGLLFNHYTYTIPGSDLGQISGPEFDEDPYYLTGWARDAGYGDEVVKVDNRAFRKKVMRTTAEKSAKYWRDYAVAQSRAYEKYTHDEIGSDYDQRVDSANFEKTALNEVADLYFEYETDVAEAVDEYTVNRASAIRNHDKSVATATHALVLATASANLTFATNEAPHASTLTVNEATAKRTYEQNEANAYITTVTFWAVGFTGLLDYWGDYQIDLAQSEFDRVSQLGQAEINRAVSLASPTTTWARRVARADYDLAVAEANATRTRTHSQADSFAALASANLAYGSTSADGQYKSKSDAITDHDKKMTQAGHTYETKLASTDKTEGQAHNRYREQFNRRITESNYVWTMDAIAIDFSNMSDEQKDKAYKRASEAAYKRYLAALNQRNSNDAKAGRTGAMARVNARVAWSKTTASGHVQLIKDLVAADTSHRETLRDSMHDHIDRLRDAEVAYSGTIVSAVKSRAIASANADAAFAKESARVERTFALASDGVSSFIAMQNATALGDYEVSLYNAHYQFMLTEFALYSASSPYELELARYRKEAALADRDWAIDRASARNQYQTALAAASHSHTITVGNINVEHAGDVADADREFAIGLADVGYRSSIEYATADADLVYEIQVAEANRVADAVGLAPTVDVMTAEKTAAYYEQRVLAWLAYAVTYSSALANMQANSAKKDSSKVYEREGKRIEKALKALNKKLGKATFKYLNEINYPYAELNESLHEANVTYADAVAAARIDHAGRIQRAENSYASASSSLEMANVRDVTPLDARREVALAEADRAFAARQAAAEIDFQFDLKAAGIDRASDRGSDEAYYHYAVAQADANRLTGFNQLQAITRRDWINLLSANYVDFREDVAAAEGQFQVDFAEATRDQTLTKADADVDFAEVHANANLTRTLGATFAQLANNVATATAENRLAYEITVADSERSMAWAQAGFEHSVGFDQAWTDYLGLINEYNGLVAYRNYTAGEVWDPDYHYDQTEREFYLERGVPASVLNRIDEIRELFTDDAASTPAGQQYPWWPALRDREDAFAEIGKDLQLAQGQADYLWSDALAEADVDYTVTKAAADRDRDKMQAAYEQAFAVTEAQAQAARDYRYAQAEGQFWIDQTAAENAERESTAVAKAGFLTAHYADKAAALYTLDQSLNLNWSEFQYQKALAEINAWNNTVDDYLQLQEDISEERSDFQALRAAALLTTTATINSASVSLATTLASQTLAKVNSAANTQFSYLVGLADATRDYRIAIAEAELDYDEAIADIAPFASNEATLIAQAESARTTKIQNAKSAQHTGFNNRLEDLMAVRRTGLAQAHYDFTAAVGGAYTATTAAIATAERQFVQYVAGDPGAGIPGILPASEDDIADLNNAYDGVESAMFVNAYSSMTDGTPWDAWREFTIAEAAGRKEHLVDGLAPETKTYRMALVGADDKYDVTLAKVDEARTKYEAAVDAQQDLKAAATLRNAALSAQATANSNTYGTTPLDGYSDLPQPPAEPFQKLDDVLGIFYGEGALFPYDRVPPAFQPEYVYAYMWLPGHLSWWGEVIEAHAGSGGYGYGPQSADFPPINPWGPGQLDDLSHVRIHAARTWQLFPAIYKRPFGGWPSPFLGTGDWSSFHGFGYQYEYFPGGEPGLDMSFGSPHYRNFYYELDVYYGASNYGSSFRLEDVNRQNEEILNRTLNPNGSLSTLSALRSSEESSVVKIDPHTGNVTLFGDPVFGGGSGSAEQGGAGSADGEEGTEFSSSDSYRTNADSVGAQWSDADVSRILAVLAKHESEFAANYIRLRPLHTKHRSLYYFSWDSDQYPNFGLHEVQGGRTSFVDADLFKRITDEGLEEGGLAEVQNGNFKIVIEAPESWDAFQVANYIVDVLHGRAGTNAEGIGAGSISRIFENYLKQRLGSNDPFVSVDTVISLYKSRVAYAMSVSAEAARQFLETGVSFIPGAGPVMVMHDAQQGNTFGVLIGVLTMGSVASVLARGAGGVLLRVGDEVLELFPVETLRRIQSLPVEKFKTLQKALDGANTTDDQLEIFRRFIFENRATVGKVGTLERAGTAKLWANLAIDQIDGYQVHHLIPWKQANESTALKYAEIVGYDINRAANLLPLPGTVDLAKADNLPLHRGPHPTMGEASEYLVFVQTRLKKLDSEWARRQLTFNELFDEIKKLEDELRAGLESKRWKLSRSDPH